MILWSRNVGTVIVLLYCLSIIQPMIPNNNPTTVELNAKKVVFLTGAAGFIGSNFLKYMFDRYPNYHFLILDALTYAGSLDNIPKYIQKSNRFEFYCGSVTNYQLVDLLMSRSDFVVHFAAESHVTRSIYDDSVFFKTDVLGTRVMMNALIQYAKKIERYIHISTSEVYGTAEYDPMDENHPLNPRSPYAAAKAGADRLVYAYWCTYDIPAVIIRPFNNYGPRQHIEKVIPRFITTAMKGESLTIHGSGLQQRDWIHVYDVCHALDLVLHIKEFSKIKNQVIQLGSGQSISVVEIAKIILDFFSLPQNSLKYIEDRPGQVERHTASTEKAYKLLGWRPEISFKKGLEETIQWYIQNKNKWEKQDLRMYVPSYSHRLIEIS